MKTGNGIALAGLVVAMSVGAASMLDASSSQGEKLGRLASSVESIQEDIRWLKDAFKLNMREEQVVSLERDSDGN